MFPFQQNANLGLKNLTLQRALA